MTPEIEQLDAEIKALEIKRNALIQARLSEMAIAQIGEMIFWSNRKGRVVSFKSWCGKVSYRVRIIKKDGSEGSVTEVAPYHKPTSFPRA